MNQRVQIAIALMSGDLRRNVSLDKVARSVGLSRSRFQHLFKVETGTSPAHYLHATRLDHARRLLETSLLSVKQIMLRVGIKDRSHFDRDFKKAYGVTPIDYRGSYLLIAVKEEGQIKRQ